MCELEPLKEDCFAEPTCQWHQERKPEYTQDNLLFKRQQTHRACGRALRPSTTTNPHHRSLTATSLFSTTSTASLHGLKHKTHVHRIFCARSTKLTNSFIHQAVRELNSLPSSSAPPNTLDSEPSDFLFARLQYILYVLHYYNISYNIYFTAITGTYVFLLHYSITTTETFCYYFLKYAYA